MSPTCEELRSRIEALLERLLAHPSDLSIYQAIRESSLQYKAAGGRSLSVLAKFRPAASAPIQGLVRAIRGWAYDPGNVDWIVIAARAIDRCAQAFADRDFEEARLWLGGILERSAV
jgi:hypothetical protein